MTIRAALITYGILMLLLALTAGSSFLDLGLGNTALNFGIALAKATLIGLVFMHLRRSGMLVSLAVLVLLFWLVILFGITLIDYTSR